MIDVCNGNAPRKPKSTYLVEAQTSGIAKTAKNFCMCETPTQPLDYLEQLGITSIWRFILSHPDMDHMDGLDPLFRAFSVLNFWDSGARRPNPKFGLFHKYKEEDWDRYESIIKGEIAGLNVLRKQNGARFPYANEPKGSCDGIHILAPDQTLIQEASEECNRASYMILYRSLGGNILIPGDAEDSTWEFVLSNYADDVRDCSVLVAPHHGRHSDMDFSFLKVVNPKLVLMGCADSEDLAYDAYRDYPHITNNQAGNVIAECTTAGIDVYVENDELAKHWSDYTPTRYVKGYPFIGTIPRT
jgi:competence protein ComEC